MMLDISGDALKLLDHFIHYASLYPGRIADAIWYDADEFARRLRLLDNAFQDAGPAPVQKKAGPRKTQPPFPDDFDRRFPEPVAGKVREWLAYKAERGDFYSPIGLRNLLTQIDSRVQGHSADAVVGLISDCMANNWAGIIWEKIGRQSTWRYGRQRLGLAGRDQLMQGSLWNEIIQGDQD
ncbi:MAG: hypothetical protein LBH09_03885 [Peptococcaceae bacterium]|nr:hypothetical protein [Peptococcaceae bacterium]